jgi:AraC-like DNA-binding protein
MSRLDLIEDWIERTRRARYDAVALAESCGISPSQLRRFFLRTFLRPPREWIHELRMWDGMELLAQGKTVKFVAGSLNYSDASHFSNAFKEYHGCAPAACVWTIERVEARLGCGVVDEPVEPWALARVRLMSPWFVAHNPLAVERRLN